MDAASKPRLGISACLLGEKVRWDGGDRRHVRLLEALGPHVEWVPVCPEVELGLGVPREPIELAGTLESPRLLGVRTGVDLTDPMRRWAERRAEELAALGLDGWVTKARSPSCALGDAPVREGDGAPTRAAQGAFVRVLSARLPSLPIADEAQLEDAAFRARFLERCRASRTA